MYSYRIEQFFLSPDRSLPENPPSLPNRRVRVSRFGIGSFFIVATVRLRFRRKTGFCSASLDISSHHEHHVLELHRFMINQTAKTQHLRLRADRIVLERERNALRHHDLLLLAPNPREKRRA